MSKHLYCVTVTNENGETSLCEKAADSLEEAKEGVEAGLTLLKSWGASDDIVNKVRSSSKIYKMVEVREKNV